MSRYPNERQCLGQLILIYKHLHLILTDCSWLVYVARLDSNLAAERVDDTGAVRTD